MVTVDIALAMLTKSTHKHPSRYFHGNLRRLDDLSLGELPNRLPVHSRYCRANIIGEKVSSKID